MAQARVGSGVYMRRVSHAGRMCRLIAGVCLLPVAVMALTDAALLSVRKGFDNRRDQMLRAQVANTYPSISADGKQQNAWPQLDYALAALYLNVEVDKANRALEEAAVISRRALAENGDKNSFHWETPLYCRIYELFHARSRFFPGRLNAQAAAAIRGVLWEWARVTARIENAAPDRVWRYWGSENHSAMREFSCWGIAQILKEEPTAAAYRYADGSTPREQYAAWTLFLKEYLREHIRKGLLVEVASPTYSKYTLQCWYNYHDFAGDQELRRLAEMALNVYWADWAQEQFDGVRGGAKSRCYQDETSWRGLTDGAAGMSWFYFEKGMPRSQHPGHMCMATSTHRLPDVVLDLALDPAGRGVYEYRSRRVGLLKAGGASAADENDPLDSSVGGVVRYTYATPEFIMGSALIPRRPLEDWAGISSQNRWQGVIFAGDPDARIFPQCVGLKNGKTYNQYWSMQDKGAMMVQKLPEKTHSKQAGDLRVWFATSLKRSETNGWIFAEAPGAWAAVRPAFGPYRWDDKNWLNVEAAKAPVIIQVARRQKYPSLESFQNAVCACPLEVREGEVHFQGLDGAGRIGFYTTSDRRPEVNGVPVDLQPARVYDSPFLRMDVGKDFVAIGKDGRRWSADVTRAIIHSITSQGR